MFKGLFLILTLLVMCFLLSLLAKLWCLSNRKTRLLRRSLSSRQQPIPQRRSGNKRYRKE
ncbi:hypothetical protein AU509_16025 [Lonsdalea britannica]|uniref:High mobility group protein Z n=1 Tax=Lonsdalea britannica TaxID=1082704 RepID=A0AAD0WK53_9GAMM|nr:hypothetical protein CKQ53_04925 [Lonsdalea britannica]OSM94275.1 hypothetical protein AU509_16025 [Lonsdalea britannica]OSN05080.1 hypothetical protein AU510_10380 [Lonsdalea britannica]